MAYVTEIRGAGTGLMDRLAAVGKGFAEARAKRRIYNTTLSELRSMGPRDLADLGISASEIPYLARQAAYGE